MRASKAGRPRHVVLTDDGITLFEWHVAGKRGAVPVLTRSDGARWQSRTSAGHCARPVAAPGLIGSECRRTEFDPSRRLWKSAKSKAIPDLGPMGLAPEIRGFVPGSSG
jgi:hypothetical protein